MIGSQGVGVFSGKLFCIQLQVFDLLHMRSNRMFVFEILVPALNCINKRVCQNCVGHLNTGNTNLLHFLIQIISPGIALFCSGDGTLRKNPMIWKKWNPQLGLSLFRLCIFFFINITQGKHDNVMIDSNSVCCLS